MNLATIGSDKELITKNEHFLKTKYPKKHHHYSPEDFWHFLNYMQREMVKSCFRQSYTCRCPGNKCQRASTCIILTLSTRHILGSVIQFKGVFMPIFSGYIRISLSLSLFACRFSMRSPVYWR